MLPLERWPLMLGGHSDVMLMSADQLIFVLLSCAGFMLAVAWFAYQRTKDSVANADGYFLAGRGLTAPFIACLLYTSDAADE